MAKGVTVSETEYTSRRDVERFYSDDEIAELFPDGDGSLVAPLLRRAQAAEADVERLRAVIEAYQQLTVAYRLGKRPTEKVLDTLQAFRVVEAAKEENSE